MERFLKMPWKGAALILNVLMIPVLVLGIDYRSTIATSKGIDGVIAVAIPWSAVLFSLAFLILAFPLRVQFLSVALSRTLCVAALIFNGLLLWEFGFLLVDGLGQDISNGLGFFVALMLGLASVPTISCVALVQGCLRRDAWGDGNRGGRSVRRDKPA